MIKSIKVTRTEICRNFRGTKINLPERVLNGGAVLLRKIIKVIGIIGKPEKAITGM